MHRAHTPGSRLSSSHWTNPVITRLQSLLQAQRKPETRGSKSLGECLRTWGANAGKQASDHQSTRLTETPSLPFPGWCQNFLTPAVFPGTQPAPAGLSPSSSLLHTCSLGPGPGKRVIRHMRGTDKTPPEPHRSYPALPSQLFELVGSRQQKEPHPPTPRATVSPAPKGALPSQCHHSL